MKKMRHLVLLLFCMASTPAFTQAPGIAWTKLHHPMFMGNQVVAIANDGFQLSDGGYIALGYSYVVNAYLVRTNSLGDTLWTKQIFNDWASGKVVTGTDIEAAGDGGYFIAGYGTNMTDAGVWLLKTDVNGNLSWWKFQSGGSVDTVWVTHDMRVAPDGGVILCGSYYSFSSDLNAFLMKFSSDGTLQWQCRFATEGAEDEGLAVENAFGGGYIHVMGFDSAGITVLKVAKISELGTKEWAYRYDEVIFNDHGCIRQTDDNHYIIAGEDEADFLLMKIEPDGDVVWIRNYGIGETQQEAFWVDQTNDGGYVLVGKNNPPGTAILDIWVVKTDGEGNMEWDKEINLYNYNDLAFKIQETADEGYILFGQDRINPDALDEVLMIKLGPAGNIDEPSENSGSLTLYQNRPNPVSAATSIKYSTSIKQQVTVTLTDITGKLIRVLEDAVRPAGTYLVTADLQDLPQGLYFCRLRGESSSATRKIIKIP